jgi:peptidoglycan/LPS O-acetylase OafA/YrhL
MRLALRRLPHLPGLDGLRALAVIAVLIYHAEASWLPGGFLGVEVFFVLSGYLVAALLLADYERSGRVDLASFWLRRARRLLPAALALIGAVVAYTLIFLPAEAAALRDDSLAALIYLMNWQLIFAQQSYFEAIGRPSLLRHLWSLAVEEQFYLIWPLLLAGALRLLRPSWALLLTLLGALGSSLLMAALYQPNIDPSRIYYGTDTRVAGMLIGAALAFVWPPDLLPLRTGRSTALQLDGLGLLALGALLICFLWFDEYLPLLYRGGFAMVALTTAVLIAVLVHPNSFVGWGLLGSAPLRAIGVRSYSIYLWHWPVFALTRPGLDLALDGPGLLLLRLGLTGALAELSYRFIEQPFRSGAVGAAWAAMRAARGLRRRRLSQRWIAGGAALGALGLALGGGLLAAPPSAPPPYMASLDEAAARAATACCITSPTPTPSATPASPTAVATPTLPASVALLSAVPAASPTAVATPTLPPAPPPPPPPPGPVFAIGDSVMLGAASELAAVLGNVEVDAEIRRQVGPMIDILRWRAASGLLPDTVVVHIGNNGYFAPGQFDEMMHILAGVRKVVVINLRVQRPWEGPNNTIIAEGVARYPNAVLLDWSAASAGRYDLFWDDGVHLRPEGARIYSALVASMR